MVCTAAPIGARVVAENGYTNCIELANATTRVVLEPNLGGRVLHYQLNGVEVLYQNASHDGRVYDPKNTTGLHPPGGRFDVGPERAVPRHPTLFFGRWTAEITGDRAARMTSQDDKATGLRLVRDFRLDAEGSHLVCTQTMINVSREKVRTCYWSRTFADDGGITFVPINPQSRYPARYALYTTGDAINFNPMPEPMIRVRDGILEVVGQPTFNKVAIDASEGWLAHVGHAGVLFVKKFPVDLSRPYMELAANSVALFYRPAMIELEPIGPMEDLAPGQSASFTEDWWLYPFAYPLDAKADLAAVRALVAKSVP